MEPGLLKSKKARHNRIHWMHLVVFTFIFVAILAFLVTALLILKNQGIEHGTITLTTISIVAGVVIGLIALLLAYLQWSHPKSSNLGDSSTISHSATLIETTTSPLETLSSNDIEVSTAPKNIRVSTYEQTSTGMNNRVHRDSQWKVVKGFTELLEELRETRRISKKDLATRANLSPGYVSLLTRGEGTAPNEEVVKLLADALKLDRETRNLFFHAAGYPSSRSLVLNNHDNSLSDTNSGRQKEDWGDVPNTIGFYGRENELEKLESWIVSDRCQMAVVLGMGGVGKSMLIAKLAEKIQGQFDNLMWRSLRDVPPIENIFRESIQLFSDQEFIDLPENVDDQLLLLLESLRNRRCLLILDNFESVLQSGTHSGQYVDGYQEYGTLIQRIGEVKHQSCLLLTSREKPREILSLAGKTMPVRSMELLGVKESDAREMLKEKDLSGTDEDWKNLIDLYSGNPLALKLVSELIREIFGSDIAAFLKEDNPIFEDIHVTLNKQFDRLSEVEQEIMYWLAIGREPISLEELRAELIPPLLSSELYEALSSLRRRSMIESQGSANFTLQPVIMEYVTDRLIELIYNELYTEQIRLFTKHSLIQAQAKDYIREIQVRLILTPIAERLRNTFGIEGFEMKLGNILTSLHEFNPQTSGYAAGNILNLLVHFNIDLRGYDFSNLPVWQAYLQNAFLWDVNFAHADLSKSTFFDTFGSVFSVAFSSNGEWLAAGTANGEVRLWDTASATPMLTLRGHTEWVRSVAFSPTENVIVSGSEDQDVRLWDTSTGECLSVKRGHTSRVYSVAFSPDGHTIASGSDDLTIRLWDVDTEECLKTLHGHSSRVYSVAFSPDGHTIASGSDDLTIRLWDVDTGECLKTLHGHSNRVRTVAFSPDGKMIASGSGDQTVKLWNVSTGECLITLSGHTHWVWSVAFSPDGKMIASGSDDQTIRLWDVSTGKCFKTLIASRVYSLAFSPDGKMIVSGSDGQIVRLWEANKGECIRTLRGFGSRIYSVAFSPTEDIIASGNEDKSVRLWESKAGEFLKTLSGHTHWVWSVAFSPDGKMIASGSEDRTVKLWDRNTGECLTTLLGHRNRVYSVAFSPDGKMVASGSGDQTVKLWNVSTGECLRILNEHNGRIYSVAFSPDGKMIASGSDDQTVKLWNVSTGECLKTLHGHSNRVRTVAFSPDGKMIASGSGDQTVKLWNVSTGECLITLSGHTHWVWSVAFSPDGKMIASCGEDHDVRLWDTKTGECLRTYHGYGVTNYSLAVTNYSLAFSRNGQMIAIGDHGGAIKLWNTQTGKCSMILKNDRPYERMNMTDVRGITLGQKAILKALGAIDSLTDTGRSL